MAVHKLEENEFLNTRSKDETMITLLESFYTQLHQSHCRFYHESGSVLRQPVPICHSRCDVEQAEESLYASDAVVAE